ncbi:zinc-ribbon domain-containing protein [Paraburkholderia sp. MPAMCS5]|uniref:zinc-ribbon domain-containing protein n=1 Tax=Paraburkholderia sp. MPAMCS5 TaxID=3112563 RepID=UPI003FA73279
MERLCEKASALGGECLEAIARVQGAHLPEGRWCKRCVVDQLWKVRLQWQCAKGHVWETSPASILTKGSRCPSCARLEHTKIPWKRKRYDVDG